jgi:hypothetical protein
LSSSTGIRPHIDVRQDKLGNNRRASHHLRDANAWIANSVHRDTALCKNIVITICIHFTLVTNVKPNVIDEIIEKGKQIIADYHFAASRLMETTEEEWVWEETDNELGLHVCIR